MRSIRPLFASATVALLAGCSAGDDAILRGAENLFRQESAATACRNYDKGTLIRFGIPGTTVESIEPAYIPNEDNVVVQDKPIFGTYTPADTANMTATELTVTDEKQMVGTIASKDCGDENTVLKVKLMNGSAINVTIPQRRPADGLSLATARYSNILGL